MDSSPWVDRWTVMRGFEAKATGDGPVRVTTDLPPTSFTVTVGNVNSRTPEDYEVQFGPDEGDEARALADEFNRYEYQGPIEATCAERYERLKMLCPDFGSFYSEGPLSARWPVAPGRYLVRDGGVGWHAEAFDQLAEDLNEVRNLIAEDEANVYEVVDLDTGEPVPFVRNVSVQLLGSLGVTP
jgi:hypothetical protein